MYGLEQNIDLNFFISKVLIQICFGVNDLIFNFSQNISVTVTSSIGIRKTGEKLYICDDFRALANCLLDLLNMDVADVRRLEEGTLLLIYADKTELYVYDDSIQYESFVINNDGIKIIV